jgi:hypothetical protein
MQALRAELLSEFEAWRWDSSIPSPPMAKCPSIPVKMVKLCSNSNLSQLFIMFHYVSKVI